MFVHLGHQRRITFTLSSLVSLTFGLAVLLLAQGGLAQPSIDKSNLPLGCFTENTGQWSDAVRYRVCLDDATVWFADNGPCFQFHVPERDGADTGTINNLLKPRWVGASGNISVEAEGCLEHLSNFFVGNDPAKWRTGVPSFKTVVYKDVYSGIDVRYYINGTDIEYDFVLSPGADISQIRIHYEGAESLDVSDAGDLVVSSPAGTLTERCPLFYQRSELNGTINSLGGAFNILSRDSFSFQLDAEHDNRGTLIIDPVLSFSTFLGGDGSEYAWSIDIDDDDNIYITGNTFSRDYPLEEALQPVYGGGEKDIFVTKLNPTDGLLYSTYLGGSGNDENPRLVVDSDRNILVIGRTFSSDFPTANALYSTRNGLSDAFIAKISSDGSSLVYSTYLGGMHDEWATGVAVDEWGYAYLTGITESEDFPTVNAYCSFLVKNDDSWVSKIAPDGGHLVYSTYIGGSGHDRARDIKVDAAGRAYITGETYSDDFPTVNAFDNNFSKNVNGITDAFLVRFSAGGTSLEYSTYLGGSANDWCNALDVTSDGKATVVGDTESDDFPTLNPFQAEQASDTAVAYLGTDVFITGFSTDGSELAYSTYLGGSNDDLSEDIALGPAGSIYVVGATYSTDFPLSNAFDNSLGVADTLDAFIVRLNNRAENLTYSTFLGGDTSDWAYSVEVNDAGAAYITGYTLSADFPLVDPLQPAREGTRDAFIVTVTGGCCSGIRGNLDGDELDIVDVSDIIYSIQWSFEHSGDPDCMEEADVDGNGRIDIEDFVYLVNYLYGAGPEPPGCGE